MPAFWGYPPPPHDYPYHWVILDPKSKEDKVKVKIFKNSPKFQIFEFWNEHYTRHTFWSCSIRCANMKWIQWVLLKIQSEHDSVHRWTHGEMDRRTRWYQYTLLSTLLKRGYNESTYLSLAQEGVYPADKECKIIFLHECITIWGEFSYHILIYNDKIVEKKSQNFEFYWPNLQI